MKNIYTITLSAGLTLLFAGCGSAPSTPATPAEVKASDAYSLDVAKVCNTKVNGVQAVLDQAAKFNPIAVKHGVEFMRFGMPASVYITETQKAIDAKADKVVLLDDKGKPTKDTLSTEFAAERACRFAINALIQENEASTEWKEAVPSYGYKY
jgi:hypothetical protein